MKIGCVADDGQRMMPDDCLVPRVRAYHLLTRQQTYRDLGENYFDERDHEGVKRHAVRRLEQLGYQVTLAPLMAVAA